MILIILYLIILAALHAKLELMIEGSRSGWAWSLPCWRINNKLTELIIGKELTGYHFYLLLLFLFIFHSPFMFINWSVKKELFSLGCFSFYWVVEDWFWFLENSYYGLRNFKKGRIFWHKRWICGLPVSYIFGILVGSILFTIGGVI